MNLPAARDKFRSFLTQKGLRVTNQRLAIFDAALTQTDHFTAEQLLDYARAMDESVSRATVYRTLPIRVESALLREVDIGTGEKFYHPNEQGGSTQVAQVVFPARIKACATLSLYKLISWSQNAGVVGAGVVFSMVPPSGRW